MIRSSESIVELACALVKAQAVMPEVPKGAVGQVGNAKRPYSDIADVIETVRPVLHAHGLAYVQFPGTDDRGVTTVTTRLMHESGQWVEGTVSMPSGGNGAQGVGSAITYARRYSLVAMLGLASEDDDGAGASQPPPRQQRQPAPRQQPQQRDASYVTVDQPNPNLISAQQLKALHAAFNGIGITDRDERLVFASNAIGKSVTSSKDLTKTEASAVFDAIAAKEQPPA